MAFAAAQWFKNADRADWQNACNALEAAFAFGYYGAYQSVSTQLIADPTVAYPITFDTVDDEWGVSIGSPSSKLVVANPGTYNLQWSGQFQNTDASDHDVSVWIRKGNDGGTTSDVVGSTGVISIPAKHGLISGHTIASWNYVLTLVANDYLQFWWCADSTTVSLQSYPAQTEPVRPSTASVIATVTQIGAVR